jgi:hypothetical protein
LVRKRENEGGRSGSGKQKEFFLSAKAGEGDRLSIGKTKSKVDMDRGIFDQ